MSRINSKYTGSWRISREGYDYFVDSVRVKETGNSYIAEIVWFCGQRVEIDLGKISSNNIAYHNHPNYCGVGYHGYGKFKTKINGKTTQEFEAWSGMLGRVYPMSESDREKFKSYKGCSVFDEWKNFQKFSEWYTKQKGYGRRCENGRHWSLDKDIIVPGNKVYHPGRCVIIPQKINSFLKRRESSTGLSGVMVKGDRFQSQCLHPITGKKAHGGTFNSAIEAENSYFEMKNEFAKILAEYWKDDIDIRVYESLMNNDMRLYLK